MNMGWRVGYQREGSSYCYLAPLPSLYPLLSCQCPSHRTQSITSCRNHCQELCQECQTIVRDFENPFSIGRLDLGLHVFADILYLRWNLSAGLPGQLKLYSTLRAFIRKLLQVKNVNQRFQSSNHLPCVVTVCVLCVQESKSYVSVRHAALGCLPFIDSFVTLTMTPPPSAAVSCNFHCSCAAWEQLAV